MNHWKIHCAANSIAQGGVIAYPTEGVWGLGCNPYNQYAVLNLLALKKRQIDMGFILVASDLSQLLPFLDQIPAIQLARIMASWPGPTTWLLSASQSPILLRGSHSTLAVRVSNHPQIRKLCDNLGHPLVSTSANPHGRPPARSHIMVRRYFKNQLDFILVGNLGGAPGPTTIRDAASGNTIRR